MINPTTSVKEDKKIKVYSIVFVERFPKGVSGLFFMMTKSLPELKECFAYVSERMIPSDDFVKVGLTEMTEKEFKETSTILDAERKEIKHLAEGGYVK